MKYFSMVVIVVSALSGCGKKADKNDQSIKETEAFTERMCACKDTDCSKKIIDEMTKSAEADKRPLSERQLDEAQQKRFDAVSKRMMECSMKAGSN